MPPARLVPPSFALALGLLGSLGCAGPDAPPPSPPPAPVPSACPAAPASFTPVAVAPTIDGEGTVTKIEKKEAVALVGPRVDAKAGDWMLENAGSVAVVSAEGRVIDFGARGGRDEITAIDPIAFLGLDGAHFELVSSEVVGGGVGKGHVLHVVRRALEKPLLLHVFVGFSGDRLRVETTVTAGAPLAGPVVVTLGERVGWSNVPTWVAGHGWVRHAGSFTTDFLARDSNGVAYAVCAEGGRMRAHFDAPESGFHEAASTGETPELVPSGANGGATTSRRILAIARASGSLGAAAMALPCGGPHTTEPIKIPSGLAASARVEVARCVAPGATIEPYARFFPGDAGATLPEGCFLMRLTEAGHTSSPWFPASASTGRTLAPAGSLHFSVVEKGTGKPLPSRVLVRGVKGTPDPDWGDDPDNGAALNVVYSDTGTGERPLPAGRYAVTVGRGFEYTAFEKEVDVTAGHATSVAVELARVVDTKGWIAADLHLHAMPSPDAIQPLADRVRALVATGVEVGVATDHNKVTDYKPVIQELGVGAWLASIVGDEVTTRDPAWGHFNVFPLPSGGEPVVYRGALPRAIFAAARGEGTLGEGTVVQVNHPRMGGIGYFELVRFDRADPKGWAARVAVGDLGFDAMEVYNGDHYAQIYKVEEVMRDWYALLDAGYRVTATGNSDSHKMTFHEPGVPRNLVHVPNDDPAAFDEKAFIEAVRAGKVVVSGGPFIRLTANGKGIGESVAPGEVEIAVEVDAPPWVDVDRVEIVSHGKVLAGWSAPFPKGPHRFESRLREKLAAGDWVIAVARGKRPMSYLYRSGATPFAFTNPIWVGPPPARASR